MKRGLLAVLLGTIALAGCVVAPAYPPGVYVGPRPHPAPYYHHWGYRGYYGHRHGW